MVGPDGLDGAQLRHHAGVYLGVGWGSTEVGFDALVEVDQLAPELEHLQRRGTRCARLGKHHLPAVAGGRLDGLAGVEGGGQGGFLGAQPGPKGGRRLRRLGCLSGGLKPRSFQPRACHALPIREDVWGALVQVGSSWGS